MNIKPFALNGDPVTTEPPMKTTQQLALIKQWGYEATISYKPESLNGGWLVNIKKPDDEMACNQWFESGSMESVVGLAYGQVERWAQADTPRFEDEIAKVINSFSRENRSDTPDWILANFIDRCLTAWEVTSAERDRYYRLAPSPGRDPVLSFEAANNSGPIELRIGAIFKIGKRLWRLIELPKQFQGEDGWKFEYTETSDGSCDQHRTFTRSELQWLYAHHAFLGQPADGYAAEL